MRVFALFLCLFLATGCGRPKEVKVFDTKVNNYLKLEADLLPHQSRGYLKPKVVVMDLGTGQVDDELFMALPAELRASNPTEVKSVIWMEWRRRWEGGGKNLQGQYVDAKFFSLEAFITVIDVSGSRPVVSYTECYNRTLPNAYRPPYPGGKFKVVQEKDGWVVETAALGPKNKCRLIHGSLRGNPPASGGEGDNVGPKPIKGVLEVLQGLPRA